MFKKLLSKTSKRTQNANAEKDADVIITALPELCSGELNSMTDFNL